MDEVGKLHIAPLKEWIARDQPFKFWGDNVDKKIGVRDVRSDHQGKLLHMYSILAGKGRIPATDLSHTGYVADIATLEPESFLPNFKEVDAIKKNMMVIVSRHLAHYIPAFATVKKLVPKHIFHKYSTEMSLPSVDTLLDVLMKNEAVNTDMVDILIHIQSYLGENYPRNHKVLQEGIR